MSATSPAQLPYDVFVSDRPAGAGDERMPDGAPLAWLPLSSTLIFGALDALLADPSFTRTQMAAGLGPGRRTPARLRSCSRAQCLPAAEP
jgi:hypothetical protein